VSRQWGSVPSSASAAGASAARGLGLEGGEVVAVPLSAWEDPAVPLPEPDVVVVGRAVRKVRVTAPLLIRWACLICVAVPLRLQLMRREDVWKTVLQDVYIRDVGRSKDAILPHCTIKLNVADALFPVGGDPQEVQNRNLLLSCLESPLAT
jgi:hypothetical protein